jgi:glutamate-1-semialdehyde 2,1-aminomutase
VTLQERYGRSGKWPSAMPALADMRFERGSGSRCWDDRGREYIDFICGYGPVILGHAHPAVTEAVSKQLARGTLFPSSSRILDEFVSTLRELFTYAEDVVVLKTGSEAVAAAIRLARAYTGREKILRCGFHGWHDQVVAPYVRWHQYDVSARTARTLRGVPNDLHGSVVVTWYGSRFEELLTSIDALGPSLAAVVIDPVELQPPFAANAKSLVERARGVGALAVLDESKTGFRVSLQGVQGLYGVEPDMTILSKGIANGLPISVVIGSGEVIRLRNDVKIKGTYSNELSAVAAALATIQVLRETDLEATLWRRGRQLIDGLNRAFRRFGVADDMVAVPFHWPCMPYIWFRGGGSQLRADFHGQLLRRGVLMLPDHMNFVSLAHTAADIEDALTAAEDALGDCMGRSPGD